METQDHLKQSINVLNDDILNRIFDYLHLDDKIKLRRTCWRWKFLLDYHLNQVKALRLGKFYHGAFEATSGLNLNCSHNIKNHRKHTASIFNERLLNLPADFETQCYSINQYDYLYKSLKQCYNSITMLSLGRLNVSYRLLMIIAHNLPNLEHLELIACASVLEKDKLSHLNRKCGQNTINSSQLKELPNLESFNNEQETHNENLYSNLLFNQNNDEQVNIRERIFRSTLVKSCELVKGSKTNKYWPNLKHLLIQDCHLLNEFSLCLIITITSSTLTHLVIDSNQYLTGEFLNYCGTRLKILRVRYCPLMQIKFLEDFIKIKQLLEPTQNKTTTEHLYPTDSTCSRDSPQPINLSLLRNLTNFNQDVYCTL